MIIDVRMSDEESTASLVEASVDDAAPQAVAPMSAIVTAPVNPSVTAASGAASPASAATPVMSMHDPNYGGGGVLLPPPPPHGQQLQDASVMSSQGPTVDNELSGSSMEEEELLDEAHELALIREFGAHPLMARVQSTLLEQLNKTLLRLTTQHRELAEELKRSQERRETVGVELYGQQQQLARLQLALETTHNAFSTAAQDRADIEEDIVRLKKAFAERTGEVVEKGKQLATNHAELEALRDTLRQVSAYNEEMKTEIAITRRATYKVEETLTQLEGVKQGQDVYIDSLAQQVKAKAAQLDAYTAQMHAQRQETDKAEIVLRETAGEMEGLRFEKRQLVLHWKSALVGLTRRDEALASALEALRGAEVSAKDYDMELEGVKRDILRQQTRNETLVSVKDRLESESRYVEEHMNKIHTEHDTLRDKFSMLLRSKEESEVEETRLQHTATLLRQQIQAIAHNLQVVTKERQALEVEVEAHTNTQASVNKAVRNLNKSAAGVVKKVHSKEMEVALMQNEIARVQVDQLDTQSHVTQLRSTLVTLDSELKVKDKLVEKYEVEIRQGNDDIDKKMYRVDRLNKKYQQLVSSVSGGTEEEPLESRGPLEAAIKHLKKETDAVESHCLALQKEWLQKQTRLVKCVSSSESQGDKVTDLKARVLILQQQQLRLAQQADTQATKANALDTATAALHKDMGRLNEFIGDATRHCTELGQEAVLKEKEFLETLSDLEHQAAQADDKLRAVLTAKHNLLDEVVELERQSMLWAKKLELEKETQAALDPEAGMAECRDMEREIHRMRLRLETLKREQEQYLQDMERAIHKHEHIALRTNNSKPAAAPTAARGSVRSSSGGVGELSNLSLRRRLRSLSNGLSIASKDSKALSLALEDRSLKLHALTTQLEHATSRYDELDKGCNSLQAHLNSLLFQKQKHAAAIARSHTLLKYFQRVGGGSLGGGCEEREGAESEHGQALKGLQDTCEVVRTLQLRFPHLQEPLARVLDLAHDAAAGAAPE